MTAETFSFPSSAIECAGHLFRPSDALRSKGGVPYVVMAHGFAATADCALDGFAKGLSAAGVGVLLFDYRGFGRSAGEPRQVVDVRRQVADYRAALQAVRALDEADPNRLGVWGASLGGGHVFRVAAAEPGLAAAVALTPAVDGTVALFHNLRREGPVAAARALSLSARDVLAAARGAAAVTMPAAGPPGSTAAVTAPNALEDYTAIAGPTWRNEVAARSLLQIPGYRPGRDAAQTSCPILVQIADRDTSVPAESIRAAARRAPRAEVRHYPCDHFDLYTGRVWHGQALDHQIAFLTRHLTPLTTLTPARSS